MNLRIVKIQTEQHGNMENQFVIIDDISEIEKLELQCRIDDTITNWNVEVLEQFDNVYTIGYVISHMSWEDYKYMQKHLDDIFI